MFNYYEEKQTDDQNGGFDQYRSQTDGQSDGFGQFGNNNYNYNSNQEYEQTSRTSPIRESETSSGKTKSIILLIIGVVLLVAAVSIISCMLFLELSGYSKSGGYTVNQISTENTTTSVDAAGTDVLTTPQVVQSVIPSVVEVNVSAYQGAATGSGSGIVFSEDGYIVTNQHVINRATAIGVKLSDGTEYEAKLVGEDEQTDLAVIKVEAKGLSAAKIGNSDELAQGETVLVIGNPLGETLSGSVSQGIVSALGREIEIEGRTMHYIQTDAAINPGNSGGPIVNQSGLVVGVASAKISSSTTEGLGFAIPINEAVPVIEDLINQGYVSGRPLIGISGEDISQQVAMIYNLPQGIYVRYVDTSSGAAKAGIQQGDIITAVNGTEISSMSELNNERDKFKAGESITLTIYRNGEKKDVTVVLGEQTVDK